MAIDAGRKAIRGFGMLSAGMRPPPDFLLIGAKRGGSTSFYFDLLDHPQVAVLFPRPEHLPKATATKGVHYFDSNFQHGSRWYASHFPSSRVRSQQTASTGLPTVAGEASPFYLSHPAAAERAARLIPRVKLIVLLRDPVERAYSHWKERTREGAEHLDFAAALRAEDDRVGSDLSRVAADPGFYSYPLEHQAYAYQSHYGRSLDSWLSHFPGTSLCALRSEDYYRDPDRVLNQAAAFLGLEPHSFPVSPARNAAPGEDLSPGLRAELQTALRPDARRLKQLVGVTWSWV